jgi:hypothetical protein
LFFDTSAADSCPQDLVRQRLPVRSGVERGALILHLERQPAANGVVHPRRREMIVVPHLPSSNLRLSRHVELALLALALARPPPRAGHR